MRVIINPTKNRLLLEKRLLQMLAKKPIRGTKDEHFNGMECNHLWGEWRHIVG